MDKYDLVDDLYASEGYDWSVIGVFRRKTDGALFWADDGGCSCNGPWECDLDPQPFNKSTFMTFRDAVMTLYGDIDTDRHEWIAKQGKLLDV